MVSECVSVFQDHLIRCQIQTSEMDFSLSSEVPFLPLLLHLVPAIRLEHLRAPPLSEQAPLHGQQLVVPQQAGVGGPGAGGHAPRGRQRAGVLEVEALHGHRDLARGGVVGLEVGPARAVPDGGLDEGGRLERGKLDKS